MILPQGSTPKVEKICTLTGAAVNLKYKVCNKITAAAMLSNLSKMNLIFTFDMIIMFSFFC